MEDLRATGAHDVQVEVGRPVPHQGDLVFAAAGALAVQPLVDLAALLRRGRRRGLRLRARNGGDAALLHAPGIVAFQLGEAGAQADLLLLQAQQAAIGGRRQLADRRGRQAGEGHRMAHDVGHEPGQHRSEQQQKRGKAQQAQRPLRRRFRFRRRWRGRRRFRGRRCGARRCGGPHQLPLQRRQGGGVLHRAQAPSGQHRLPTHQPEVGQRRPFQRGGQQIAQHAGAVVAVFLEPLRLGLHLFHQLAELVERGAAILRLQVIQRGDRAGLAGEPLDRLGQHIRLGEQPGMARHATPGQMLHHLGAVILRHAVQHARRAAAAPVGLAK